MRLHASPREAGALALGEALGRRVREMAEQPWLFNREGEDWRWLSWLQASERITDLRRNLGKGDRGRKAYEAGPSPDAYLVDLALRLEGFLPVAVETHEVEEQGFDRLEDRLCVPDEGQSVLLDGMSRLRAFDGLLGHSPDRDVVVLGNGPRDALDRLLLDWTLLHGGAAVFEHDPARLFLTLIWVRPTIHHGPSTLLAGLTNHLFEEPKTRKQLLKRARLALDGGPEGLSDRHSRLWKDQNIQVVDVSSCLGTRSALGQES